MVVAEMFVQALLGLMTLIAIGAFSYLMGRLGALDRNVGELTETVTDLYQRVYGRNHDKGDPGGLVVEVKREFRRLHRRLDGLSRRVEHDRRERRRDRRKIRRRLNQLSNGELEDAMSNGELDDVMGFGDDDEQPGRYDGDGYSQYDDYDGDPDDDE